MFCHYPANTSELDHISLSTRRKNTLSYLCIPFHSTQRLTNDVLLLSNSFHQFTSIFWLVFASFRISSTISDITKQAKYLQDLKEHVDARSGENPAEFFSAIVAGILLPRLRGEAAFASGIEHKNRVTCLEILERTPRSDHIRQYLTDILQTLTPLLERDTEEVAVVVLRILADLHRASTEDMAILFLDVIKRAHQRLPNTVSFIFAAKPGGAQSGASGAAGAPGGAQGGANAAGGAEAGKKESSNEPKPRAEHSMKLFTETPTSVMLLLKTHPNLFNFTEWTQLMMSTLRVIPPDNALATNRSLYSDLILAQTKTFWFLCTLLNMVLSKKDDGAKMMGEITNALPDLKFLPRCIVRLLKNCPPEAISTRRDILFALRQLVTAQNTFVGYQSNHPPGQPGYAPPAIQNPGWAELWNNFLDQMEDLTDERTLIGPGRTAHETLRYQAWSIAAEYVNQSRNKLNMTQLVNLVGIYGKHVHDPALSTSSVTFSLRLLSKLAEVIAQHDAPEPHKRAQLLAKILDIFVNKLVTLKRQIPDLLLSVAKANQLEEQKEAAEKEKREKKKEEKEEASKDERNKKEDGKKEKDDNKKESSEDSGSSSMQVDAPAASSASPAPKDGSTSSGAASSASSSAASSSTQSDSNKSKSSFSMIPFTDDETEEERVLAEEAKWSASLESVKESALSKDDPTSPMQHLSETRQLVSVTINVIKAALNQLHSHHAHHRPSKFILVEEILILNRFVRNVTRCLSVYDAPKLVDKSKEGSEGDQPTNNEDASSSASTHVSGSSPTKGQLVPNSMCAPAASEAFEKDCTALSSILLPLDTNTLEDLLTSNLPYMYGVILEFPFLMTIIHALMNTNLPPNQNNAPARPHVKTLNDLLLQFLITKIPVLSTAGQVEAAILQRLFKALFQTIGRQLDDPLMSPTWAPLLSGVVSQVLRLATETKDPINFFHLLRNLFRHIPKNDIWSKELAHQLPTIIDTINRIQENTSSQALKDLLIELPLTLPVRVSAMLPCFKLFMKPLLAALETSESEGYSYQAKTNFALRFLENYIGQFSTEFFEPLIAEYKARLLKALWRHMRQPPALFTSQVMRILGRMGGRVRPYAIAPLPINVDDASTLTLALSFDMPVVKTESMDTTGDENAAETTSSTSGDASAAPSQSQAEEINVPLISADPSVKNVPRVIELPLLEAIMSARRIIFLLSPPVPTNPAGTPSSAPSYSPQMTARKMSAFNFLKGCLFAMLRPYADSPPTSKSLALHASGSSTRTSGQISSDEALTVMSNSDAPGASDATHPLKLLTQPQYPAFVEIRSAPSNGGSSSEGPTTRVKTLHQLESERHSLKLILSSLISAAATDTLKATASEVLEQVTNHLALLFVTNATPNPSTLLELDPLVLIDAITDVLSSENRDHATAAITVIDYLLDACMKLDPEYVAPKEDSSAKKSSSSKASGSQSSNSSAMNQGSSFTAPSSQKRDIEKEELNEGKSSAFLLGLPVLSHLVQRLCDVCFKREWNYKVGGCAGIRHLLTRLPTGWIRHHQLAFLQAILFVLKDYPLGATPSVTEDAVHTFLKVLRASNTVGGGLIAMESGLDEALLFLASNLTSTNSLVRKTIQTALDKLAEWSGSEVTELLENHRKAILEPMFEHPLSRVGIKLQQSYLDAAAYCLGLRPPLIPDSPDLRSFLQEAIALTDGNADEVMRNVPLATALVDALAAAVVGWKPFQAPENMELRTKTIALFLRTLSIATSRPLLQSAKRGLEVSAELMSRRTLQDVVSPILSNLSNGKLTEHMLEGLGRFLALFPKFFTPELGKKLLDQLTPYTLVGEGIAETMIPALLTASVQPAMLASQQQLQQQLMSLPKLEPNESALKVTSAVLELCHLLPQANKLLERVVDITMKLESRAALWSQPPERRRLAPKELTSSFRAPLAKYLNRLPQESLAYFFSKLHDVEHTMLFASCLKSEHAAALREELSRSATKLIEAAFPSSLSIHTTPHAQDESPFNRQYSFVLLVKTLLKFYPDWLTQQRDILSRLHTMWNSSDRMDRLKHESQLPLRYARETTYLIQCLTRYLRQNHVDGALFLDLLSALTTPYCNGLTDLIDFYQNYVPENYTVQEKRALLERVLADFAPEPASSTTGGSSSSASSGGNQRQGYSLLHKQQILKSFVIRIFEWAVEKGQTDLLTKDLISLFLTNLFSLEQDQGGVRIYLAYELLSLLGLMLKNAPTELEEHLKDLIRFGWHFQRNEDPYTKQNANALFSAIIKDRTSIAPPRIRITVYAALMRSYQGEVRTSVREALEMLVPVLLAPSATPDQQYIKWTRKVLYEESQQPQQLFHILYVLAKHEACFRPWRAMFYSSLATSFPKLTPHSLNSPPEHRKLAITVIDLLLTWERLRIKNSETPKIEDASSATNSASTPAATASSTTEGSENATPSTASATSTTPTPVTPAAGTGTDDKNSTAQTSASAPAAADGAPAVLDYGDGKLPPVHIDHIVSTLMTASLLSDPVSRGITPPGQPPNPSPPMDLSFVFMRLVKDALEVWPNATVKLSFIFVRVLEKAENSTAPYSRALLLLDTIFRVQPAMVAKHASELTNSLPPLVLLDSTETNRALCQLLALLLSMYPIGSVGNPLEALYNNILAQLERAMSSEKPAVENALALLKILLKPPPPPSPPAITASDSSESTSSSTMQVDDAEKKAETADGATPAANKEQAEVKKESSAMEVDEPAAATSAEATASTTDASLTSNNALRSSENAMAVDGASSSDKKPTNATETTATEPIAPPPPKEVDILSPLVVPLMKMANRARDTVLAKPEDPNAKKPDGTPLLTIFKLLVPRLSTMGPDIRRHLIGSIGVLFEKSQDEQFLLALIALTETLPLDSKETNAVLQRMRRFDRSRTAPIGEAYFNFIFTMYNRFKTSEIAALEPVFLSVLTTRDSNIRSKFLAKFAARLPAGFAKRFEALLRPQTWEALPHLYWLQPSTELLLAQADASLSATLGGAAARLSQPRYTTSAGTKASGSTPATSASIKATQAILDSERNLLETLKNTTVGDLLRPLSDLIYQDFELAGFVWAALVQGTLQADSVSTSTLIKADPYASLPNQFAPNSDVKILKRLAWQHIQTILTPDDGNRGGQRLLPPVAQTLLRVSHTCNMHLPPKLVKYVGSTYHVWHLAVRILEERITAGFAGRSPDAPPGVVVHFPNHQPSLYQSLGDLYSRLYEDDYVTSLLVNQSVMEDTKAGMVLMQQGAFSRAQEVFYQGLHDVSKGLIENISEQEQTIWETQWIECAKRLNQWDVVGSYAKSVGSVELAAESSWKLGDWDTLKEALGKFPSADTAKHAALQAYATLTDKNPEVDTSLAMNLILTQWVSLPKTPCAAYTPLLVTLQRFIDIHDSIKIVKDMKTPDFMNKIHDIKTMHFRLWRERLPHECDDMTHWHDVLQWRQHMFSMLTSALTMAQPQQNPSSPVLGLGHHEAAWAINKMAHIARKQGLVDICFTSLPKIYELPNIEVQDAFTKVCEHIKCYFRLPLPASRGILDILNTTNLNYFSSILKAEFYHLRAEYHARTGAYEDAAKAYSSAVVLCPSLPKVWTGWGKFYDERLEALLAHSQYNSQMQTEAIAPASLFDAATTASITSANLASSLSIPANPNAMAISPSGENANANSETSAALLSSSTGSVSAAGTLSGNAAGTPNVLSSSSAHTPVPPPASTTPGPSSKSSSAPHASTSRLTAAHYALSCYLLALKANPQISSRKMLVRVLWLLGYDDELCGEETSVAAAITAAAANSSGSAMSTAAHSMVPNTPATPLHTSTANVTAPSTSSTEESSAAANSKKREASSPPSAEDDSHVSKKRKLSETDNAEESHQMEGGSTAASPSAGNKMDVDSTATSAAQSTPAASSSTAATPSAASNAITGSTNVPATTSSEKPGISTSTFLVPPTPNTPATPSAYMIAATPATPAPPALGSIGTGSNLPGSNAHSSDPSNASASASSAAGASSSAAGGALGSSIDPVMLEIGRVRKMRLLCTTFCEHVENLPAWIWLVWLPQLLSGLDRPEALAMHAVLKKVSTHYPHAIYFPLRTWILERQAKFAKLGADPTTTVHNLTTERMALWLAEDLMNLLREKVPATCADLERMSNDLEQIATLTLPETLLDALQTVIRTTYDVLQLEDGIPTHIDERRAKLALQLQLVHQHLFVAPNLAAAARENSSSSTSASNANAGTSGSSSNDAPSANAPASPRNTRTRRSTRTRQDASGDQTVSTSSTPAPTSSGAGSSSGGGSSANNSGNTAFGMSFDDQHGKWHAYTAEAMRAKLQPKFEEDFGAWLNFSGLAHASSASMMNSSSNGMDMDIDGDANNGNSSSNNGSSSGADGSSAVGASSASASSSGANVSNLTGSSQSGSVGGGGVGNMGSEGMGDSSSSSSGQFRRPSMRSTLVKLKYWAQELERLVAAIPTWLELRKCSWLAQVQSDHILEMPAIYMEDKEMSPDTCVLIDKFESPIRVSKSSGLPRRIVTIRGSNGQFYYWYVQSCSMLPVSLAHVSPISEMRHMVTSSLHLTNTASNSGSNSPIHHGSSLSASSSNISGGAHASSSSGGDYGGQGKMSEGGSSSHGAGDSKDGVDHNGKSSSSSPLSTRSTRVSTRSRRGGVGAEQSGKRSSGSGVSSSQMQSSSSSSSLAADGSAGGTSGSDRSRSRSKRGASSSGSGSGGHSSGGSGSHGGRVVDSEDGGICGGEDGVHSRSGSHAHFSSPRAAAEVALGAIPQTLLWQREARFAQIVRVSNRMWQKDIHVRKRAAALTAPLLVNMSPTLRLVSFEKDSISIDDATLEWHSKTASSASDVLSIYDSLVGGKKSEMVTTLIDGSAAYNGTRTRHGLSPEAEFAIASRERLAMHEAARCATSDDALMQMLYSYVSDNYEGVWHVRKVLVANLAQLSLLQYLFSSTLCVTPQHLLISPSTGTIQCFDFAPQMTAAGDLLSTPAVPFRLSPNILRFIGPAIKASLFEATLTASTMVLDKPNPRALLSHHLNLLMRDDLHDLLRHALITTQHAELNSANPTATVSHQLKRNIKLIMDRLTKIAPPSIAVYRPNTTTAINAEIEKLIDAAMDPLAASKMPVSWSAWV